MDNKVKNCKKEITKMNYQFKGQKKWNMSSEICFLSCSYIFLAFLGTLAISYSKWSTGIDNTLVALTEYNIHGISK